MGQLAEEWLATGSTDTAGEHNKNWLLLPLPQTGRPSRRRLLVLSTTVVDDDDACRCRCRRRRCYCQADH